MIVLTLDKESILKQGQEATAEERKATIEEYVKLDDNLALFVEKFNGREVAVTFESVIDTEGYKYGFVTMTIKSIFELADEICFSDGLFILPVFQYTRGIIKILSEIE